MANSTASRIRVPHTLILLTGMILIAQLLTYVLPKGSFEKVTNDHHREQVIPGTYAPIEDAPLLPWYTTFSSIPRGFAEAQGIIFFCFIIGGAFGVMRATGAIDAFLGRLLSDFKDRPGLLIAGTLIVFGIGSSSIGMAEEFLPFLPVLVALSVGLGYDRLLGVAILCVGYGVGYGSAAFNPFTVVIAQEIAGLPPTSGWPFRIGLFVVFAAIGLQHVFAYAKKIRRDPAASLVADVSDEGSAPPVPDSHPHFTRAHISILVLLAATILLLVWGISKYGWYLTEMGALFLGLSLIFAIVSKLSPDAAAKAFCVGAGELTTTALLIGFARTIELVLSDGQVVDTIIHSISQPLQQMGATGAAIGMLVLQSVCNFFIPSGSGQAYVTMPLMTPLSDIVGVQRQVAVLAYQFGDGFTNIVVPTNAVLVGILGLAGVPYDRWFRFVWPLMLKFMLVAAAALAVAVAIGYS
jgi:uncharacterized ion transporter superfamily protein YfcC